MNIVAMVADFVLSFFNNPSDDVKGYATLLGVIVLFYGAFGLAGISVWLGIKIKKMRANFA